jgi:hypothetical protein
MSLPIYAKDRIVRLYPTVNSSYFLVLPKGLSPSNFIKESWIKNENPDLEPKVYTYYDIITEPIYIGFYIDKTKEIPTPKLSEVLNKITGKLKEKFQKQGGQEKSSGEHKKTTGKVIKKAATYHLLYIGPRGAEYIRVSHSKYIAVPKKKKN